MKPGAWAVIAVLVGGAAALTQPHETLLPEAAAATGVCTANSCAFVSPSRGIDCVISFQSPAGRPDSATCAWRDDDRAYLVKLLPNGALEPCINPAVTLVDRCKSAPQSGLPVLGYGETAALGPFTCLAEARSITCLAAPAGKGFTINSTGIIPAFAPPPPPPPAPVDPPRIGPPTEFPMGLPAGQPALPPLA